MRRSSLGIWAARCLAAAVILSCATLARAQPVPPGKQRYISLAPSTTEILFALGLGDEVVGVSSFCNYPEATRLKPRVGDFSHPNTEIILSLKPDYIFCTGLEQDPVIAELRRLNFKVYVADPANMHDLYTTIIDIGAITARQPQAASLVVSMKSRVAAVQARVAHIPAEKKAKLFIEIWSDPLMTAGKGSFVDELASLAGGINIAHETPRPYSIFSAEKVVSLDPNCIILAYMDKEPPLKLVSGRFGWQKIDAVKNNRVFNDISPDILLRPGPRVVEGLEELFKKLYPVQ